GEMSLFEDAPRSATIRTVKDSRFMVLQKNEFSEIIREYPQITMHICRAFCQRIRELHVKIDSYEK
ncbi:MAG: cyclic nucleotide-binding domain-containing protein, partial [Deltaproteobacteria bacterium]|nr:cyclic nucleotide-binding domain-containing protein [Deltaproteobacteria bacterium]